MLILFFIYSQVLIAGRSTKGITRLSPSERASIKLPGDVKDVLIGILLGVFIFIFKKIKIKNAQVKI